MTLLFFIAYTPPDRTELLEWLVFSKYRTVVIILLAMRTLLVSLSVCNITIWISTSIYQSKNIPPSLSQYYLFDRKEEIELSVKMILCELLQKMIDKVRHDLVRLNNMNVILP
jgi:uncharacterized membrane protein